MKNLLLALMLVLFGTAQAQEHDTAHWCGSHEKLTEGMQNNLSLIMSMNKLNNGPLSEFRGNITIPVVVHILYGDSSEIISLDDIQAQIDGINSDFNATGWDIDSTDEDFQDIIANFKVDFKLATVDPDGDSTGGITYTKTNNWYFSMRGEDAKFTDLGGHDTWNSNRYLNIWVCSLESRLRGYAQFPFENKTSTDGIVLDFNSFGVEETVYTTVPRQIMVDSVMQFVVDSTQHIRHYRVVSHEIGHWMGLFHIWGDEVCGNDHVKDTPTQYGPHRTCGELLELCGSPDLPNNFMDYIPTECMLMFTEGQRKRAMKAMRLFRRELVRYGPRLTK